MASYDSWGFTKTTPSDLKKDVYVYKATQYNKIGERTLVDYQGNDKYDSIIYQDRVKGGVFETRTGASISKNDIVAATAEEIYHFRECERAKAFVPFSEVIVWKYIAKFKKNIYILATEGADGISRWEDWVEPITHYFRPDMSLSKVKPGFSSHNLSIKELTCIINDKTKNEWQKEKLNLSQDSNFVKRATELGKS